MINTEDQFDKAIDICRYVYEQKLIDYGAAWRILRPSSLTDQILIKANRIRGIETKGTMKIQEGLLNELVGIVNYSVMGMIQLELGFSESSDLTVEQALELYNKHIQRSKHLMLDKNHDYGEVWRSMRNSSYTDLILMKLYRVKQIEDNSGKTLISEGIDANYMDIANYALFGIIKIEL